MIALSKLFENKLLSRLPTLPGNLIRIKNSIKRKIGKINKQQKEIKNV